MNKILFVADSLKSGGVERSLLSILETFNHSEYIIDILILNGDKCNLNNINNIPVNKKITPFFNSLRSNIGIMRPIYSLKIIYILIKSSFKKKYKNLSKGNKIRYYLIDKYISVNNEYDISIAFNVSHLVYLVDKKIKSKKKIAWFHGDASDKTIDIRSYVEILNKMDKIVCVSNKSAKSLSSMVIPRKLIVIENFINIPKTSDSYNPFAETIDSFNIISIGRLSKEKNYIGLVNSMTHFLKNEGKNCVLYIIGDGPEFPTIKKSIIDNGLSNNIKLIGWVDNPIAYIENADLLIHPSKYEGFGLSIYECAYMGKNVICYDVADTRINSKVLKNIYVVEDEDDLIEKIKKLSKNKQLYNFDYEKVLVEHNDMVRNKLINLLDNN